MSALHLRAVLLLVVLIAVALGPVDQAQVARASESGSLSLSAVKTSLEYFESGTTVRAEHVPQAGYKLVMLRGGTVLCTTSGTSCSRQVEVGLGESVTIEARVQTGPVAAPTSIAATSTVTIARGVWQGGGQVPWSGVTVS